MDHLWAPWRAQYIRESSARPQGEVPECFLCAGLAGQDDRANLLVWRRGASAVFLNRFPYNNGHVLVAPLVHRGTLAELDGPVKVALPVCLHAHIQQILRQGVEIPLAPGDAQGFFKFAIGLRHVAADLVDQPQTH